MRLTHGLHLAYCTNIHRGEDWAETLHSLEKYTLAVRRRVSPDQPYAIGLRLSDRASRELIQPTVLKSFQRWLAQHDCYVFTINGFPYGQFHGRRVKEQVSQPDWTSLDRLEYTCRLFDILAEISQPGVEASVSTVPVSFKQFRLTQRQRRIAREHLWRCAEHQEVLARRTGKTFHLGLEPEPFGEVENTSEFLELFDELADDRPGDQRLQEHLGINYDTCHFALQYEQPATALKRLQQRGVRISKLHLSNALSVHPTREVRQRLRAFIDDIYFHQVIERRADGELVRYADLDEALTTQESEGPQADREWRIHFHIPLHAPATTDFGNTSAHLVGVLDVLKEHPRWCSHLEMETYTWEVLPGELKQRTVVDQLVDEYRWTLGALSQRGIDKTK